MYQSAFSANKREIRDVLGVPRDAYDEVDEAMDALWARSGKSLLFPSTAFCPRAFITPFSLRSSSLLPHLAIFSDEAPHTYGKDIGKDLKKVRLTVDYLADKTNLICTVNTTGTP